MIYLAEIEWKVDAEFPGGYYCRPEGIMFDLRNLADQGVPNQTAGKFVLASGPVVPAGAVAVGEIGFALTPARKLGIQSALGLGEAIVADDVTSFLSELAVNLGDPSNVSRWATPSVGAGGFIELWFNGFRIRKRVQVGDPEFRQTLMSKRIAYAKWRVEALAAAQALQDAGRTWEQVVARAQNRSMDATDIALHKRGDPQQHLKNLGALVKLYGLDYHTFLEAVPGHHLAQPDEGVRDPATKILDTLTDTAATSLDAHTQTGGGDSPGWTWVETLGTELVIDSSGTEVAAANSATGTEARAESALSSSAHYSQWIRTTHSNDASNSNALARHSASARDFIAYIFHNNATTTHRTFKYTAGTPTQVGSTVNESGLALPSTLKLQCTSVDALSGYIGGVLKIGPSTDATNNGNVRAGLGITGIAADSLEGDNFEAADTGFDLDRIERRTMRGHLRGHMRGT